MPSKVQERIFAERAATLLCANWKLQEIAEPLDFEVCCASELFGLEIRQIFIDAEGKFGSLKKRTESKNRTTLSKLSKHFYKAGGPPICAKFVGLLPDDIHYLAESMVSQAPLSPGHIRTIETRALKVFMTPLPAAMLNYSRWTFVNDRTGFLKAVTSSELQKAVNKKAHKLALYKQKYEDIDLLLVADRTFSSGKLVNGKHSLQVANPGFRSIYFMSYPDAIARIG